MASLPSPDHDTCDFMKLLRAYNGRKGSNWGMANHIQRINLFSFLIAAALFTSAVNGHQNDAIATPSADSHYLQAVSSPPSPQAFSIERRRELEFAPESAPTGSPYVPYPTQESSPSPRSDWSPPAPPPSSSPPTATPFPAPPPLLSSPVASDGPPPPPPVSSPVTSYGPPPSPPPSSPSPRSLPSAHDSPPSLSLPISTTPDVTNKKKKSTGVIVGTIIAGIAVFALIGLAVAWRYKKKPAHGDPEQPVDDEGACDGSETTLQSPKDAHAFLPAKGTAMAYSMETQAAVKPASRTAEVTTTSAAEEPRGHAAVEAPVKTADRKARVPTAAHYFTYNEIQRITGYFKTAIGEGGSATVYYGRLEEGSRNVAVKKLKGSSGPQLGNLLEEIKILMRIHHRNLVSLVGLCEEQDEIILVAEFMANGSLFHLLRDRRSELTWRKRLEIALNAATGLEYLHHGCKPSIIHRDIKSTNILLDENLEAKLADFGLSKAGALDGSELSTYHTKVAGTVGYIDPEYLYTQTLTKKSDVYSFGVVLFELITGKPAIVITETNEKLHLTRWVMPMLVRGNIESLLDPLLKGHCNIESVWEVAAIAKNATQHPNGRPDMPEIVSALKAALRMQTSWVETDFSSETITSQSSFRETTHNPVAR